jgi:hypothetical protein
MRTQNLFRLCANPTFAVPFDKLRTGLDTGFRHPCRNDEPISFMRLPCARPCPVECVISRNIIGICRIDCVKSRNICVVR